MNCSKDFLTDAPGLVQNYKLTFNYFNNNI